MTDAPKPRIYRETWRQEKAVVFARVCVVGPHKFLAHDRAKASGQNSHRWQAKRGVRKGTPDTQLIVPGMHVWFEMKAPGERVNDGDDQDLMLAALRDLGDKATWGVTIMEMATFWHENGVSLVPNWQYQAMHYDGLVDSRIAKAEGKVPGVKKKSYRKPTVRAPGTVKQAHRRGAWG
jgi:hypothetical protein